MKLHCLGTAGYHPGEVRHTSCYYLPEIGLALDAGSGLFRLKPLIDRPHIDIVLSHAHLDHVMGLTFLLSLTGCTPLERVRVHAAAEHLRTVQEHLLSPGLFPVKPPIEWRPLPEDGSPLQLADGQLRHLRLTQHPGHSTAYRLDLHHRSLAYVTDTICGPEASYRSLIERVDLLIHECNFPDSQKELALMTGHSWLSEVLGLAHTCRVKQLALTHFSPFADPDNPLGCQLHTLTHLPAFQLRDQQIVDF
jgi:ribonuclease Z